MKDKVVKKHIRHSWLMYAFLAILSVTMMSCMRGKPSEKPPIHLNPNMDDQARYDAMEASPFFADGRAMRMPPEGTVARDDFHENDALFYGKDEKGNFVKRIPVEVTEALMTRGQERYNIFCAPCHSKAGDGNGIVWTHHPLQP